MKSKIATLLATVFGIGHLRPAPGSWGSLAALPMAYGLHMTGSIWALLIGCIAVIILGWWASDIYQKSTGTHDASEIVIDEVAGQWIALLPVSFGAAYTGANILDLWPGWIAAFVLFRLFDIRKPWLVGRADARGDALGVMLDDIIAGLFAGLAVIVLAIIAHGAILL